MATINTRHPMGAARYVRMERYAWPGGYATALLTSDGGLLCPDCVASEWPQIAYSNRHKLRDGWRPAGIISESETDDSAVCDHCGRVIWESKLDDEEA